MSNDKTLEQRDSTFTLPAWLWAPCALYAISAALILIGLAQIIVPIYDERGLRAMEKFYCLIALNVYEIALLGVALLLILMRRVLDDAIAVTLILCIFLAGSSITLDTVAPGHADAAMMFGAAGLLMAMTKLFALNRFVVGRMNGLILAGLGVWMAVNCLLPGWLGLVLAEATEVAEATTSTAAQTNLITVRPALLSVWLTAWLVTIGGGVLVLIGIAVVPTGEAGGDDIGQPFLRTAAMRSIVMGVVMAATFVHLYAVTFAFNLNVQWYHMLPAAGLAVLVLLEILRAYGFRFNVLDTIVALTPALLATGVAMSQRDVITSGEPAWITDPAVFLGGFSLLLFLTALRRGQVAIHYVWLTCAGLTVLMAGVDPQLPLSDKLASMNWSAVGFVVSAALVISAIWHNRIAPAVAAAGVLAFSVVNLDAIAALMHTHGLRVGMVVMLVTGLGWQVVYAVVPGRLPRTIGAGGAVMVAVGVIACCLPAQTMVGGALEWLDWDRHWAQTPVDVTIVPSLACAAVLSLVGWRTRDRVVIAAAGTPMTLELFQSPTGWTLVLLSFAVLGLALARSWRKGNGAQVVRQTDQLTNGATTLLSDTRGASVS